MGSCCKLFLRAAEILTAVAKNAAGNPIDVPVMRRDSSQLYQLEPLVCDSKATARTH